MAKARAIVKRRKAVRNIRKITKTMQMIATAKFQKALKRAVGAKPYTLKIRELVAQLASTMGQVRHPLLEAPTPEQQSNRIALLVITSNRGLAGAYNGSILRSAVAFIRQQEAAGKTVDLYVHGKKGLAYFKFQKRSMKQKLEQFSDFPKYSEIERVSEFIMKQFLAHEIDAAYVCFMNFISTSTQRPEVMQLLPMGGAREAADRLALEVKEKEVQAARGSMDTSHRGDTVRVEAQALHAEVTYDFMPGAKELLDELLPLTVQTGFYQAFLDATTSENVARMVAMKSATDNADKMIKSLTMQYNRARQSQITTELSEIMGGVEAMKA